MLLDPSLVLDSISRAKGKRFDPKKLQDRLGEGDRRSESDTTQRRGRYIEFLAETEDASLAHQALERVLAGNDLVSINYLERGTNAARSVRSRHGLLVETKAASNGDSFVLPKPADNLTITLVDTLEGVADRYGEGTADLVALGLEHRRRGSRR